MKFIFITSILILIIYSINMIKLQNSEKIKDIYLDKDSCHKNGDKCSSPRDCCVGTYCDKYNSDRCIPDSI